jgi:hypothetical protein
LFHFSIFLIFLLSLGFSFTIFYVCKHRDYAIIYHGVHCSFVSLGQTLMRDGHVDNLLIPCFCRKLFEDSHPSKSGRHYFFPYIGVCKPTVLTAYHISLLFFVKSLFSIMCFYLVSYVLIQESILDLSNPQHESLVRTSFLGAASASKGKRLELSDTVCCTCLYNVPCTSFLFDAIMLFTHFITCVIVYFLCSYFFLYVTWNTGLLLLLTSSGSFLFSSTCFMAQNLIIN